MNDHSHHPEPLAPVEARVAAIESVLVEHGMFDTEMLDAIVANFEDNLGPLNGAKVVARAWVDPDYKARLLADGTAAIAELGFSGPEGDHMVVVENTPHVHNLVVCTLCSCYPWPTLGLPPAWYKAPAYRSRAVREPRVLLAEMGTAVPDDVEIRGMGLERRGPLPRAPRTAVRHRRGLRGRAGRPRHPRLDDRSGTPVSAELPDTVALMDGLGALPRDNGELMFAAPWEARALALAVALVERLDLPWDTFRLRLIEADRRRARSSVLRELGRCAGGARRRYRAQPRPPRSTPRHQPSARPSDGHEQNTERLAAILHWASGGS